MRTDEQISKIKSQFTDPYVVADFIDNNDLKTLTEIFKGADNINAPLVYKNTGPITLDINPYLNLSVFEKIFRNIKKEIGDFEMTAGFFFKTNFPHIIHNDDTFELPDSVYKAITIPLEFEGPTGVFGKLCIFDQCYFHGPAKFFNGSSNIPTYYNKQLYEYSEVDGIVPEKIVDTNNYFTHLNPNWLNGLSINTILDQVPGTALIFDSVRLHCATDFRQQQIKSKLAISIFTRKV